MLTSTYHVSEDDHVFELGDDVPPDEVREDLQETEPLQVGVVQLEEDDWEQLSLSQLSAPLTVESVTFKNLPDSA